VFRVFRGFGFHKANHQSRETHEKNTNRKVLDFSDNFVASWQDARAEYTRLHQAYQNDEHPEYTKGFQFDLPTDDTADPDVKTLGATA